MLFPIIKARSFHEEGVRVCGNAVMRYVWCGFAVIFILTRYCGFKALSGLRLLQPLTRGFR